MKVLIADHQFGRAGPAARDRLEAGGLAVVANPHHRRLTAGELVALAQSCAGIIAGSERYPAEVLAQLPDLRCICRVGVGVDNVDVAAARARGIDVQITPNAPVRAVAEYTVGLILAVLRGIVRMDRRLRRGEWERHIGRELGSAVVGLIGLGRIGRAVAELLRGLGAETCGTDVAPVEEWARVHGVTLLPIDELLARAEVVSVHVPYVPATHHLLDRRRIGLMRRGAYLINTSRGGLVDEAALYDALVEGRLAGAALDVFGTEPYRGPLAEFEQVVITPHAATFTEQTRDAMDQEAVENLLRCLGLARWVGSSAS